MSNDNAAISGTIGTTTTLALTQLTTLSAAAATGIGSIVAAAIVLFETFRGTAHLRANDIVQNLENPYGALLSRIVDTKDRLFASGTATYDQMKAARDAIALSWAQYQEVTRQYAQQGGDFALVAQQSLSNLNGPQGIITKVPESERYGANGFIDALINKTDAQSATLTFGVVNIAGQSVAVTKNNWYLFAIAAVVLVVIIRKVL